ncbi:MAG: hypothetical protein KKE17_11085 [Proteobacteria bacterium]|nr:hypothetical protein [Pseudomonadota bacterium]MBU1710537.1 hypothetical protein [Pseudomonadota bacterium]
MNLSKVFKVHNGVGKQDGPQSSVGGLDLTETEFLSYEALWQLTEEKYGPTGDEGSEFAIALRNADAIIQKAQDDAARIEEEAYNKGYDRGQREASAAGKKNITQVMQQYDLLLAAIRDQQSVIIKKYEQDTLHVIKAMVNKLVNHEVSVNSRVIKAILQQAMENVIENSTVKVHLNKEDFARIKEAGLSDPAFLEGANRVHLIEDPNVSMGGCLLETGFGEIDATLENRNALIFKAIDQAFLVALSQDHPDD